MFNNIIALSFLFNFFILGVVHAAQYANDDYPKNQWYLRIHEYLPRPTDNRACLLITTVSQQADSLPLAAHCNIEDALVIKSTQNGHRSFFPDIYSFQRRDLPKEMKGAFDEIHIHREINKPLHYYDVLFWLLRPQGQLFDYLGDCDSEFPRLKNELESIGFQQVCLKFDKNKSTCGKKLAIAYAERGSATDESSLSMSASAASSLPCPNHGALSRMATAPEFTIKHMEYYQADIELLNFLGVKKKSVAISSTALSTAAAASSASAAASSSTYSAVSTSAMAAASSSFHADDDEASSASSIMDANERAPLLRSLGRSLSNIKPKGKSRFFSRQE